MKTLFINIIGEEIKGSEDVIVVGTPNDAIVDKFYYELGKEIVKGVDAPGIRGLAKHIVKSYKDIDEKAFGKITEQWLKVKDNLLGEDPTGTETIELPMEYVKWLQNYGDASHTEIAKSLSARKCLVEISLDKIYRNSINIIINSIEPDNYGQFVVNDGVVTDDSAISIAIMNKFDGIAFKPYKKEDVCSNCGKNPCECPKGCSKCGKSPCECKNDEQSAFFLIAMDKDGSHDIFNVKGISVYDKSHSEIFSKRSNYGSLERRLDSINPGEPLKLFIGDSFGWGDSCDAIGFDGKQREVKKEDCPWHKLKPYDTFNKETFLKKHPEYDDCYQPYHEVKKDEYIIEAYRKVAYNSHSFTVDVWNSKDKFLCTLPVGTGIDRVLPSGLYVIWQWIDEDYLAYGIADRYGKILLPCQYKKRHRMNPNMAPEFSEKAPGVVECDEFPNENIRHCYYRNLFNGDFYNNVTTDYFVKQLHDEYERMFVSIIDKDTLQELYKLQSDGIHEITKGWYQAYIDSVDKNLYRYEEKTHWAIFNKRTLIEFHHGELLYDSYAEHAFENLKNIAERYFISDSHIITMTETSEANGLGVFETIRIYTCDGKLIKEYEFSQLPLLIKSQYKYGKALCLKIQGRDISIWYLDSNGKEHLIPHKGGFKLDDYSKTEMFMVSEDAFVINKKGDYCGELRSIEGDVLFKKASWILPFADKYLAYYSKSGGKYGVIDSRGNKIIPPKFDEYEFIEHVGGKYIYYDQYGNYKEL